MKHIWPKFQGFVACYSTQLCIVKKPHIPVMAKEVVEYLSPKPGEIFVDMTFGAGGHTKAMLSACSDLNVICLDRDPIAIDYANQLRQQCDYRSLTSLTGRFSELFDLILKVPLNINQSIQSNCNANNYELVSTTTKHSKLGDAGVKNSLVNEFLTCDGIDMIIMDLGISSMQLDDIERGFSIRTDASLDMRMSGHKDEFGARSVTASDVVNNLSAGDLARVFSIYGEEPFAWRIARAIAQHRVTHGPFTSTHQLSALIAQVTTAASTSSVNKRIAALLQKDLVEGGEADFPIGRHQSTVRVFQALRIFVNDELNELAIGLELAYRLLKPGGRLAVISFHSLEDRLVKWALNAHVHITTASAILRSLGNQSITVTEAGLGLARYLESMSMMGKRNIANATANNSILERREVGGGVQRYQQLLRQCQGEEIEESGEGDGVEKSTAERKMLWKSVIGPFRPTHEEVKCNSRSRSAKLRMATKV